MQPKYFALTFLIICALTVAVVTQNNQALEFTSQASSGWAMAANKADENIIQPLSDFYNQVTKMDSSEKQKPLPLRFQPELNSADQTSPKHVWNFSGTGLTENELNSYLQVPTPKAIYYYRNQELVRLTPAEIESMIYSERFLFVSDMNTIQELIHQREAQTAALTEDNRALEEGDPETSLNEKPLPENAFEIVSFTAGKRDDGSTLVPIATNLLQALQGPDYSLEPFNWRDPEEMKAHLSRILSFGHGGELIVKVSGQGYLKDKAGFDFALYENAFRTGSGLNIVQEFARVGVSNTLDGEFYWFPCDPLSNVLSGCLGAVPTSEGGDQFDIAQLGLDEIRYIKIQDLGINKNNTSRWPTEGCDLDAVRLFHAYTQE